MAQQDAPRLTTDSAQAARREVLKSQQQFRNQWIDHLDTVIHNNEYNNRQRQCLYVLLVFEILVCGQKHVEVHCGQGEPGCASQIKAN